MYNLIGPLKLLIFCKKENLIHDQSMLKYFEKEEVVLVGNGPVGILEYWQYSVFSVDCVKWILVKVCIYVSCSFLYE